MPRTKVTIDTGLIILIFVWVTLAFCIGRNTNRLGSLARQPCHNSVKPKIKSYV